MSSPAVAAPSAADTHAAESNHATAAAATATTTTSASSAAAVAADQPAAAASDSAATAAAAAAAAAAPSAPSSSLELPATSDSHGQLELPAHNSIYKRHEYWEERFSKEEKYEWLSGYSSVRDLLRGLLRPTDRILHLGCGNSELARDLYLDGFTHITNIDFSAACIAAQRAKNADCPLMEWRVMDMLQLSDSFPPSSFDVVLDKCTLDALVVDEGDVWDPRAEVRQQVDQVLTGVSRVLRPDGGAYIQLSFGQPVHRLEHYLDKEKYGWTCTVDTWAADKGADSGFGYFLYTMRRTTDTAALARRFAEKAALKAAEALRLREYEEQQRRAHQSDSDDDDEGKLFCMDY